IGGVGHGEDLKYLWGYNENLDRFPVSDIRILNQYVGLLTNFVKNLNPTPEPSEKFDNVLWPKMTPNHFYYLNINKTLTVQENPREFSYGKWVDLYNEYARKPLISF
ncbi:Alpha/Beta hydrolase fold, partial [Gonioctena quinquepunctata]